VPPQPLFYDDMTNKDAYTVAAFVAEGLAA